MFIVYILEPCEDFDTLEVALFGAIFLGTRADKPPLPSREFLNVVFFPSPPAFLPAAVPIINDPSLLSWFSIWLSLGGAFRSSLIFLEKEGDVELGSEP